MQSFVRSLLSSTAGDSTVLSQVVAEASDQWAHSPASLRDQPRYAGGLFRGALVRRALASMSQLGELPLVLSLEHWVEGPQHSPGAPLTVLCSAGRHTTLVDALERTGWTVRRGRGRSWLSLHGAPEGLWLCEGFSEDAAFGLDLARLRARAVLDELRMGAVAARPSAEDGLSIWVALQGHALLRGRRPEGSVVQRWQELFPSEPKPLELVLRQHGLLRLGRLMLRVASDRAPGGGSLATLTDNSARQPLVGALARAAWITHDSSTSRVLGSAAAYALDDDPKRAARALAQRAQRIWVRRRARREEER